MQAWSSDDGPTLPFAVSVVVVEVDHDGVTVDGDARFEGVGDPPNDVEDEVAIGANGELVCPNV